MLAGVLAVLIADGFFAARGPRDLLLLRERRADLEQQRAALQLQQTELQSRVSNLRSNDRYLEHLIRTELGYARPDEMVYRFAPRESSDSPGGPAPNARRRRRSVLAGLTLQLLSEVGFANK